MELISVIVAVYNAEKFLRRCVESIQNQTYENIEILLIDDGSTDKSSEICDEYEVEDTRVTVIHKENRGAASSRNRGLDVAKGDYIFFVDCDDYIDKNTLEIMLERIHKNQADIAVCDYAYIDINEKRIGNDKSEGLLNELLTGKQLLIKNSLGKEKPIVVVWNKLYKRKIFDKLRFEEGKVHEDELFFHKMCDQCEIIAIVGKELYFYTQRDNSIMGNYDYRRGLDALEAYLQRILYMQSIREPKMQLACDRTIKQFYYMSFRYSNNLGFDNYDLNMQMIKLRKNVWSFLPVLLSKSSMRLKEKIEFAVWLVSPKIYGKLRRTKSRERK